MSKHIDWQEPLFDHVDYARKVRLALAERNQSFREAAPEIGISHTTLYRVAKCVGSPDIESYFRINQWLSMPQDTA